MPRVIFLSPSLCGSAPAVLPRLCGSLSEFHADVFPLLLVIPNDCGLLSLFCAYWNGTEAAND